jgi:hypothetical protein
MVFAMLVRVQHNKSQVKANSIMRQEREQCLNSLSFPEARLRIDGVESPFKDTYTWMWESHIDFSGWLCSKASGIYWISGKPAAGKSTAMKYVMKHGKTRAMLSLCDRRDWVIAGFFFHDRGSRDQKSVNGLLREIAFQILQARKDLLKKLAIPLYRKKVKEAEERKIRKQNIGGTEPFDNEASHLDDTGTLSWSDQEIQDFFASIFKDAAINLNLCLFIDALDEHEGDHRRLLSILHDLIHPAYPQHVHVKLCLASRPENIFKDAFAEYPGFAIHDHTVVDIQKFVRGKLAPVLCLHQPSERGSSVQLLVQEIVDKARGVFLWVKLVVAELIEGICEGDSIIELRRLLLVIPPELGGLYLRALNRPSRRSLPPAIKKRQKYERWIMFQIALCVPHPLSLESFMMATSFNTQDLSGTSLLHEIMLHKLSGEEMCRRLAVRSAGLLDTTRSGPSSYGNVEFIHQTVKEFVQESEVRRILCTDLDDLNPENGQLLFSRYEYFQLIREELETVELPELHAVVKVVSKAARKQLDTIKNWSALMRLSSLPKETVQTPDFGSMILFEYWINNFALAELLEDCASWSEKAKGRLLAGAIWCSLELMRQMLPQPTDGDIVEVFLRQGIHPDSRFLDCTALEAVLCHAAERYGNGEVLAQITATLLANGADPKQLMTSWSYKGAPAIVVAAKFEQAEIVALLLKHGADPWQKDLHGKSALDYAGENKDTDTIDAIQQALSDSKR